MKEMKIITPAEKHSETERNLVLVLLVKNAKALPMPVSSPASSVSENANYIVVVSGTFLDSV